jgi:outer membrane lipoprotein-sorting protein
VRLLPAVAILALGFLALPSPSQADGRKLSAEEVRIVSSVNDYLNSFDNLEGYFVQTGPSGKFTSGRFFMSRPGRVRFEYEPPSPLRIVADGSWVSIENRKLKTSEHYPLRTTPLKIILGKNINLLKSADVTLAFRDENRITVTLHDHGIIDNGQITLVFQTEDMVLKEWIVIDAQGLQTRVSVSELVTGIQRSRKLFFIKKPDFPESDR